VADVSHIAFQLCSAFKLSAQTLQFLHDGVDKPRAVVIRKTIGESGDALKHV
jgi:hypothetical protein